MVEESSDLAEFVGGDFFSREGALDEAYLMVTEKMDAAMEAFGSILTGSSSKDVIERYRELVAANAERLR